jgi:hypothetical protein
MRPQRFLSWRLRLALAIGLGSDTQPADGLIEGLVEEVDSCIELRFRTTSELLKFLVQRFDIASTARPKRGNPNKFR